MSEATIDKLSIEITSNSIGASQGIDALADSLGKLKSNGSVGVAVKNLNNLSDALKKLTPVTSNANKLGALADSIDKLSSVGSITKVVNQLNKLPGALRGLSGLNIDNDLGGKLERLAQATTPLSNIKTGGLGTMVNALGKIGKVTDSLDDDTIGKFADRVRKLNTELEPLSRKMTTIQQGLKGINTSARSASTGVSAFDGKVKTARLNLASLVTVVQGAISVMMPLVRLFSDMIGEAIEWDGIAARFGRGFGNQADEVYQWIQRLNKEMGINVQQFMQYSSVFATMLQGFGVGVEDAGKMALGYTELIYDIWAGYNDVYKSFADAAEAVKSAIAGEVEPIRRAGFTIVEATLEQTAANHGLEISLENATEAQKSYLRYLTLVDQAYSQNLVGTYARELNTAEGLMRTFSQQVKSLAQAVGSLFLPAIVNIMPYIQALIELLTQAVQWLAALFGMKIQAVSWGGGFSAASSSLAGFGESAQGATDSLESTADAVEKTTNKIKDLKNATIGIDELNVISPPKEASASGGGGGGGGGGVGDDLGLDVESLWDESIFNQVKSKVDEIKEKIEAWLPVIATVAGALAGLGIATLLRNLGDALEKMNLLQKLFATVAIVAIEAMLVFTFADNYLESGNLLYLIGEALTTAASGYLLFKAWGTKGLVMALTVSIVAQLVAINASIKDGTVSLNDSEVWIQAFTTALTSAFGAAWIASKTGFPKGIAFAVGLSVGVSLVLADIRNGGIASGEIANDSWESWLTKIGSVLSAGIGGAVLGKKFGNSGLGLIIGVTVSLVMNLVGTIEAKGEDFGNEISDWLDAAFAVIGTTFTAAKIWKTLSPIVTPALSGLMPKIGTALSGAFTGGWSAITGAISSIPVWGWIVAAIAALIGLAIVDYDFTDVGHKIGEFIGKACRWVADRLSDFGDWTLKVAQWIGDGINSALEWAAETFEGKNIWEIIGLIFFELPAQAFEKLLEFGADIAMGVVDGINAAWDNFCGNIGEFFQGLYDGFCEAFGIASPAKKMNPIGDFIVRGIWEGFNGFDILGKVSEWAGNLWDKISSFFGGKKTTTEKIEVAVSLVKSGWSTVKGWIGNIPGVSQAVSLIKSGWTSIKSWVGSTSVISQAIKLVKSGWSTISKWVGSTTTISQAIKLVKSGWTSIKKWVGSTTAISQAIKLAKSGWSTIKKWVGSVPTMSIPMKLAKSGWSTIAKWLGDLTFKLKFKLPKIGINWGTKEVLGFKITFPQSFYTYAKGGFPDLGELFIAREAGPEMVGKIGNKTTVANNEQIVEGISQGVYEAVLSAMRQSESGGAQAVNVYLDGRKIASSVEKYQRERGAKIVTNGMYAY